MAASGRAGRGRAVAEWGPRAELELVSKTFFYVIVHFCVYQVKYEGSCNY